VDSHVTLFFPPIDGAIVSLHGVSSAERTYVVRVCSWIAAANAAFDDWQSSEGLGFITVAPIDARNPDVGTYCISQIQAHCLPIQY
jgi:hypothetical protein